ncbi:putative sodium-dependent transporter YocR [Tubulanus polymorphus]|uniref:putative sodium-dependent transporter YocR n=1 Tax=Tubulanus polymorphus TaxID=672921 RepID=UPI003DA52F66
MDGVARNGLGKMNQFTSGATAVISTLGLMIGAANIWRFPRVVAKNSDSQGSLVFLIVWLLFTFLWSVPMVTFELAVGRFTKKSVILSFQQLLGNRSIWAAAIIQLILFAHTCFYTVITGWCLYYMCYIITYGLPGNLTESELIFNDFTASRWPILFQGLCCVMSGLLLVKGAVSIERANIFLLPILLAIIVFNLFWSISRPHAINGLKYMFNPNWGSLGKASVWVDACSHNAFDTSAGAGSLLTYATMMSRDQPIVKYGILLPITNNIVSLSSGITIFSLVFSTLTPLNYSQTEIVEILKTSGPGGTGITFIWTPVLYSSIGVTGRVIAALFFLCLFCAGFSSLIAMMETVAKTIIQFGIKSRLVAVMVVVIFHFLCGLPSSISLFLLSNQDYVWNVSLLLSGLCFQGLLISYGSNRFRTDAVNNFTTGSDCYLPVIWEYICKYICPLEAVGLLIWWFVNAVTKDIARHRPWYRMANRGIFITVIEWFLLFMLAVLFNLLSAVFKPEWYIDSSNHQLSKEETTIKPDDPEIGGNDDVEP